MSQSILWWRALVLSCVVLCIAFAVGASGQGSKATTTFATVDTQKVANEFRERQAVETELRLMQAKYQGRLQRRDNYPFLTEDEHKQLDQLTEKDPQQQTPADKTKIEELLKKGQQLATDIDALRQKPDKDLTEADKQKLRDAETAFQKAKQQYAVIKDQLESEFGLAGKAKSDALIKAVRDAVAKVAEQKGISIVFNSEVALYAGMDITPQVLAELNKKK
jgi:Skp family chaperone for outer membrane proteins